MWIRPAIILNLITIEFSLTNYIENDPISTEGHANLFDMKTSKKYQNIRLMEPKKGIHLNRPSYSPWTRWSVCQEGRKTRRRHCVLKRVCGDSLRVQVSRCRQRNRGRKKMTQNTKFGNYMIIPQRRQLDSEDVQKRFRGFSQWSSWTNCSRKCTTVRRRRCMKRSICGRKIVKHSAYCYLEGSFCHTWIRNRMQKRQDPGDLEHRACSITSHASTGSGDTSRRLPNGSDCPLLWSTRTVSRLCSREVQGPYERHDPDHRRKAGAAW